MKRAGKEVTFLSLVIQHNQRTPRVAQLLSGPRNNLLIAKSDFVGSRENVAQNINRAVDGIREFEEHEQAYRFNR
jgi:hypothetical protein